MIGRRMVAGAAGAFAIVGRARAADAIRFGYIADYQNASLPAIATDQKYWEAEGLAPDIKVFTNGPIQIQAMGANSLDFGAIGPGALWLPASGRSRILAVNLLTFSDRVIAQAGITSLADLKGKKVGVPQGTSGEMVLRLALGKAGMSIADVQVVPMDPSTVVAAFSSRQIDGAGLWYPLVDVIRKRVPDVRELANDQEFYPEISFPNTFVARNEVVTGNPGLARRFVRVLKRAMDWRVANFDRSVELSAAMLGQPVDAVRSIALTTKLLTSQDLVKLTNDGTVEGWFGKFNDMFKAFGTLPNGLSPSQYYEKEMFVSA